MKLLTRTRLPGGASVCRVRVLRADGTEEDRGVVSIQLRWWNPRDWFRVTRNLKEFGWQRSR